MENTTKIAWAIGTAVLTLAVGCLLFAFKGDVTKLAGTITSPSTDLDYLVLHQGIKVGNNGSQVQQLKFSSCNPTFYGTSLAATTSGTFICADANVNAGDTIIGDMPVGAGLNASGSGSPLGGFVLVATTATTSGVVDFTIANFTGAASSSFAQATTSVEYLVLR